MTDHRAHRHRRTGAHHLPVESSRCPSGPCCPGSLLAALLALVAMYFVGAEQGATSLINGTAVHEWTHDGRHLLGFPCH